MTKNRLMPASVVSPSSRSGDVIRTVFANPGGARDPAGEETNVEVGRSATSYHVTYRRALTLDWEEGRFSHFSL